MAQEITITAQLQATKGNYTLPKHGSSSQKIDMAVGAGGAPGVVEATNAANGVNLSFTGITTLGWIYMKNLSDTATVDFGVVVSGTLHIVGSMKPSEPALFRLKSGITFAVKSSEASSKVQAVAIND